MFVVNTNLISFQRTTYVNDSIARYAHIAHTEITGLDVDGLDRMTDRFCLLHVEQRWSEATDAYSHPILVAYINGVYSMGKS